MPAVPLRSVTKRGPCVRFGVEPPNYPTSATVERVVNVAHAVERHGFAPFWTAGLVVLQETVQNLPTSGSTPRSS
jgi:hypothetical protein